MTRVSAAVALPALGAAALAVLVLSLMTGSVTIAPADVFDALRGREPSLASDVVLGLRLPRAMSALAIGGLLAVTGALLQALLRNPLADPYVLGVSGGASVTALIAIMLGLPAFGVVGVNQRLPEGEQRECREGEVDDPHARRVRGLAAGLAVLLVPLDPVPQPGFVLGLFLTPSLALGVRLSVGFRAPLRVAANRFS